MENEIITKEETPASKIYKQIELVKSMIAPKASTEELILFSAHCAKTGLDPITKQIHFVKRFSKSQNKEVASFQTSIDGYRLIADRTNKYAGNDDYRFDEGLDEYTHIKTNRELPTTATATVYKIVEGIRVPYAATARWSEYCPAGSQAFMWNKMPYLMLGKCAEALALRKAFPNELSGVYTKEEMDQADNPVVVEEVKNISEDIIVETEKKISLESILNSIKKINDLEQLSSKENSFRTFLDEKKGMYSESEQEAIRNTFVEQRRALSKVQPVVEDINIEDKPDSKDVEELLIKAENEIKKATTPEEIEKIRNSVEYMPLEENEDFLKAIAVQKVKMIPEESEEKPVEDKLEKVWLQEWQLTNMLKKIASGKSSEVREEMKKYKMRREYRSELEKALNAS